MHDDSDDSGMAHPTMPWLMLPLRSVLFAFTASLSAFAAEPVSPRPTGTIEGRAINAASGNYVEGVRITIETTSLEAFTDADGFYRLPEVPAGAVRLRGFYT